MSVCPQESRGGRQCAPRLPAGLGRVTRGHGEVLYLQISLQVLCLRVAMGGPSPGQNHELPEDTSVTKAGSCHGCLIGESCLALRVAERWGGGLEGESNRKSTDLRLEGERGWASSLLDGSLPGPPSRPTLAAAALCLLQLPLSCVCGLLASSFRPCLSRAAIFQPAAAASAATP